MRNKSRLRLDAFTPYRLSVLTNRISGAIARHYSERFDLSIPQWRVMAVLGETPGLSARDVAGRTAMDKVQVSRAVARLKKTHRIEQRAVEGDRRARHLFLTEDGHEVYAEIVPLARDYEQRVTAPLNAAERAQLDRLLDKLTAAARAL